jgi:hypothetical protein
LLGRKHRRIHLTLEAGPLSRWAAGLLRPLVERLVICEPRHNRLIRSHLINSTCTQNVGV